MLQTVCVYCGASTRVSPLYLEAARSVGLSLGKNNLNVVYGGGRAGLMGAVADAALESGGKVIGIIPQHLQDREEKHDDLTELHIVNSMHERKQLMVMKSDAFVILPGGYGTLDEAFEILTWKQLGLHNKPILFVNINSFWSPLKDFKSKLLQENFIKEGDLDLFHFVETPDELVPALQAMLT
jgi:uncharacterized protein (TIGR00730 family)